MRSYSYVYYIVFFGRKKTHREYKPKRLTEDICFILIISYEKNGRLFRAVGAGEPGEGGHGPPDFDKSVSPISTGWGEGG